MNAGKQPVIGMSDIFPLDSKSHAFLVYAKYYYHKP